MQKLVVFVLLAASCGLGANRKLTAVIVDGLNNHDWAAATAAIRTILEGSGRFTVDVCSYPKLPEFSRYDARSGACARNLRPRRRRVSGIPRRQ